MSIGSPVAVQARVLFALVMREMSTRYGRSAGGYIWAVLDPAGFIVMISIVFSQIAASPPIGDNFGLFYATAYMALHFYLDISSNVSFSLHLNRPLLTFPRVTILDTVFARFILSFLTCCVATTVILGFLVMIADEALSIDLRSIFLAVSLSSLLGLGMGALNCVLFVYSRTWQQLFNIINRPLFLISGIFFLYEDMPRGIQDVLWWNPLIHSTGLMRAGFYPSYEASFASPLFAALAALVPLMLAVLLFRILRARLMERP